MVDAGGGTDCLAGVAGLGDNAIAAHAGKWFDRIIYTGGGTAFVCGYFAGDFSGLRGAEYAAAGDAFDSGTAADADAFRRVNTYGKYAAMGSDCYADSPHNSFCGVLSGNIVPRSRIQRGLEAFCHAAGDRSGIVCIFALPFQEKRCSIR